MSTLFNRLAESASSTWRLLSDTTNFLSRMKLLESYERELRRGASSSHTRARTRRCIKDVREDIVALRRAPARAGL